MDLLTWAILRRRKLAPGKPFDLTRHLFLVDIYNCTARRMVLYKASQMGASEYLVSYAFHAADARQATVLYVFPTDHHVYDFSSARFGPAIEASEYLDRVVVEGKAAGGKRGADRVTLKRVGDRFIYLRGAKVDPDGQAHQLKSVDADVVILDEWDEMDPRAPVIARKRMGNSLIAEERAVSTPTYTGRGIHAEWLESDQREWHVPCPRCGHWQIMGIHNVVLEWDDQERPVAWHGQKEGRAWAGCSRCGAELNRLAPGRWVATWTEREVAGFHLTRLFSPVANLLEIVALLGSTNETKRKETYNQDLGEPYVPRGGQLDAATLDQCRRDYLHGPGFVDKEHTQREPTVMGADVGRVIYAVIRGAAHPETGERPQRWAGAVDSFERLGRLIQQYNVQRAVIDALPETRKARELQAAEKAGVVWLAYYTTQKVGTKRQDPMEWDRNQGVVNLDRTRTLDMTIARFLDQENTLPANARDVRDYYEQLGAPVRVIEDGPGGQPVAVYVERGPDHLAHAENYCTVASMAPARTLQTGQVRFYG